ncbi:MAG: archease [Desulfuromonas sp.]|nr:archease [Desulfuromonas sp.]
MDRYQLIEHTADMGIEAEASTLTALFVQAALALRQIVFAQTRSAVLQYKSISVSGEDREELLVNWLNEILYQVEVHHFYPESFRIDQQTDRQLQATLSGSGFLLNGNMLQHEVKSVTYHQLELKHDRARNCWFARIYVDL